MIIGRNARTPSGESGLKCGVNQLHVLDKTGVENCVVLDKTGV